MKKSILSMLMFLILSLGSTNAQTCCKSTNESCQPQKCCPTQPDCCENEEELKDPNKKVAETKMSTKLKAIKDEEPMKEKKMIIKKK